MIIKKEYKFYAGHRNQDLKDKCFRPHGHDYKVFIFFNVKRTGSISTLFGDFDSIVEPMLKDEFDHRFLIDKNDKLVSYLRAYEAATKESLGYVELDRPSSVENLCYELFKRIEGKSRFDIDRIELQETRSSTLIYTRLDYLNDRDIFNE